MRVSNPFGCLKKKTKFNCPSPFSLQNKLMENELVQSTHLCCGTIIRPVGSTICLFPEGVAAMMTLVFKLLPNDHTLEIYWLLSSSVEYFIKLLLVYFSWIRWEEWVVQNGEGKRRESSYILHQCSRNEWVSHIPDLTKYNAGVCSKLLSYQVAQLNQPANKFQSHSVCMSIVTTFVIKK